MKVQNLGAIFIRVSNLDRALPFYSNVLGLQLRDVEQWDNGRGANYTIPNQSRITSYNVCYTKLLRNLFYRVDNYCTTVDQKQENYTKLNF